METLGFILLAIFVGISVGIFLLKTVFIGFAFAVAAATANNNEERGLSSIVTIACIIGVIGALAILMFIF
ncbi:hypothetical protein [Campylobacter fetus]|uniref:hypothetical protein n=1 Tax=Campylobacter fetus TaxID=196 RepID=UPI000FCAFD16|nr:hypothetical protein [Campylobacter fetus]RUT49893.1 hypothetical protein BWK67_06020 [Campylobacter fetus]RUT50154.1 hypothetical protein BWK51_06000 [Campylobacter fetus]